jgi:hypothetical protein
MMWHGRLTYLPNLGAQVPSYCYDWLAIVIHYEEILGGGRSIGNDLNSTAQSLLQLIVVVPACGFVAALDGRYSHVLYTVYIWSMVLCTYTTYAEGGMCPIEATSNMTMVLL